MTETTVNRVVGLYKEKSELYDELSNVLDEKSNFKIVYERVGLFTGNIVNVGFNTISKYFLAEIKKLTEEHIKNRIKEIDKELKDL